MRGKSAALRFCQALAKPLLALAITTPILGCGLGKSEVMDLRLTIQGPTTLKVGQQVLYLVDIEPTPRPPTYPSLMGVEVVWSSSSPAVATITERMSLLPGGDVGMPGGMVTAKAVGEFVITATPRHLRKGVTGQMTPDSLTVTVIN